MNSFEQYLNMKILTFNLLLVFSSVLGLRKNNSKIVGGYLTTIQYFPFQLQLMTDQYFCGGSIISANWAMTAAHCLNGAIQYDFRAGATNFDTGGSIHQGYYKIIHPSYNAQKIDYDIALAKVNPPFPIGIPGVAAVNLPSDTPFAGAAVKVSGWGRIQYNGALSGQLKAANLNIINRLSCSVQVGTIATTRMLCAKSTDSSVCNGDSGGPLVDYAARIQYGITSWTVNCMLDTPGGFVNVAYFRSWISQQTGV